MSASNNFLISDTGARLLSVNQYKIIDAKMKYFTCLHLDLPYGNW